MKERVCPCGKIAGDGEQCRLVGCRWKLEAEIDRLRAALEEIKLKGVTTGYGRAALAHIARRALTTTEGQ